jgi:hypothetical protein
MLQKARKDSLPATLTTEQFKLAKKASGFTGIFIAGPRDRWPTTFGISADSKSAYDRIQRGYWEEQFVHAFLLTPGPPAAMRIKNKLAERLKPKQQFFCRSWYNISADEAIEELLRVAQAEGVGLFDEVEEARRYQIAFTKALEKKIGVQRVASPPNVIPWRPKR